MKGPTYIEKQPHILKLQEYSMTKHYKQLESIKHNKSKLLDRSTPETFRVNRKKHQQNEFRNNEIYRENQLLLDKLLTLTRNKEKITKLKSSDSRYFFPKSMNIYK